MSIGTERQPRTKVPGNWRPPGKGPHDDPEVRLGYRMKHAPANTRHRAGVHLREFRLTEVEGGWRAMVKGDRGNEPVVCYIFAETYATALIICITSLDINYVTWHHDAYPPKRYGNPTTPLRF